MVFRFRSNRHSLSGRADILMGYATGANCDTVWANEVRQVDFCYIQVGANSEKIGHAHRRPLESGRFVNSSSIRKVEMMRRFRVPLWIVVCLIALPRAVAANYQDEVVADDPFLYYRFNETTGDVALDSSGNGHDGEYFGVELGVASAGDSLGTAARFDGQSALVNVPILDFESETLTIETWLNVDYILGGCCTSIFSPTGWQPGWLHYNLGEPGRVEFALNSGGPNDRWTFDDSLPLEEWAHVVSTYDAGEACARIWINGEEVEFDIPTFDSPQAVTLIVEAQIGAWQDSRYLAGAIDEFAIYNSVLSEERIVAHYNAAMGSDVLGDFDGSGALDVADVDALVEQIAAGTNEALFDLNSDSMVNDNDLTIWVKDLKKTWFGDANLDNEFNSSDLVVVLAAGAYEADVKAVWSTGDFTADGRAASSDLVAALADGGYEIGPPAAINPVPEPNGIGILTIALGLAAVSSTLRKGRRL